MLFSTLVVETGLNSASLHSNYVTTGLLLILKAENKTAETYTIPDQIYPYDQKIDPIGQCIFFFFFLKITKTSPVKIYLHKVTHVITYISKITNILLKKSKCILNMAGFEKNNRNLFDKTIVFKHTI